jgi:hypothetical protein
MEKAHGDTLRLMEWSGNPDNFGILMSDRRGELDDTVSDSAARPRASISTTASWSVSVASAGRPHTG